MITGSVGKDGKNLEQDVIAIQVLINKCISFIVPRAQLTPTGICDEETIGAITDFQNLVVKLRPPDGRVDPGGITLQALTIVASGNPFIPGAPPTSDGRKYTDSPNERVTSRTRPTPAEVVNMLLANWPQLNKTAAKVLTAQSMAETGDWKYCYNWNLGNVKARAEDTHMYLNDVWECIASDKAQSHVDRANGLAHIATVAEAKRRGWSCPGKSIVVFKPPHAQCRFRAYDSLGDGAQRWIGHHQKIASRDVGYLPALNGGDIAAVARILKASGYYTADETEYKNAMTSKKKVVDRAVGD